MNQVTNHLQETDILPSIVLPDIGRPGLDLLFCGYNAGGKSACKGHYFSNEGNRFWRILAETRLAPELDPSLDHKLPNYGIGLTDLLKHSVHGDVAKPTDCDRERLEELILDWQPAAVAFLGRRPASGFLNVPKRALGWGNLHRFVGRSELVMVPDPSGGNGHFDRLRVYWEGLAVKVLSDRGKPSG